MPESTLERAVEARVQLVRRLAAEGRMLGVAWSGGKDSSVALAITLEGYRRARADGEDLWPLTVLHGDTGVENPAIAAHVSEQIQHIEAFASSRGLDVRIEITQPSLATSWAVRIIGGSGLPVWTSSRTRDCSVDWKRVPNDRAARRVAIAYREEAIAASSDDRGKTRLLLKSGRTLELITILGTRYGESQSRNGRMAARGDVAGEIRRNDAGRSVLPLIADFSIDDVWTFLALAGSSPGVPFPGYAPSYVDTIAVYRDSSGECPVVADVAGGATAACGARFGCWSCCAVSKDRSMENMLVQPQYAYMRGLAELRDYLAAIRYDWRRRRWIPRQADPITGYLRFGPDAFHPAELRRLLGYCLTLDVREQERAARLREDLAAFRQATDQGSSFRGWSDPYLRQLAQAGEDPDLTYVSRMVEPQFQVIDRRALLAIDFRWARYGLGRPHDALAIYAAVYRLGRRFDVPRLEPSPPSAVPAKCWYRPKAASRSFMGLYDPLADAMTELCAAPDAVQVDRDTVMVAHETSTEFDVDDEAAALILELELDACLERCADPHARPWDAAAYYLRMGAVVLPEGQSKRSWQLVANAQMLAAEGISAEAIGYPDGVKLISDAEHASLRQRLSPSAPARRSTADQLQLFA